MVNKQIFANGFPFVFTLSTMHFIMTCGLLNLMAKGFGFFQPAYLPLQMNLLVAVFGVGSICLMNFSLKLNSIGFYQVMKLCVVPCCLVINAISYGEYSSRKIIGSLVLVLMGVGIATVTDVSFNAPGFICGVFAVVITAQYQIWQGKKQQEYKLSSQQLALSVSFFQIFVAGVCAIMFEIDGVRDFLGDDTAHSAAVSEEESPSLWILILVSCLLAVSVNVHSFALIGKTSAVTFQVVGHGKTCLILLSGYFMHVQEGKPMSDLFSNIFGVAVALCGVILYSHLKINPNGQSDWCDKMLPNSVLKYFEAGYHRVPRV